MACANDRLYRRLVTEVLERPDLLNDPLFINRRVRSQNKEKLRAIIAGVFASDKLENWMTKMLKVNPHLVCPAAVQLAFDQTHLIRRTQNAIFCLRCAAASGCSRHSLSIYRMTSNFLFNSSRALPQLSRDEREINLLYRARSELPR